MAVDSEMRKPRGPTGGRDVVASASSRATPLWTAFAVAALLTSDFTSFASGHQPLPKAPEDPPETAVASCGGVTRATRGILQTPGFPGPFRVPLRCTWVIDASSGHAPGSSVLVRLTQVFVAGGLRFESFTRLDMAPVYGGRPWWSGGRPRAGRIPSEGRQLIFDSDFGSSPPLEEVAWIRSAAPYLVVSLSIDSLEGSHIRDLGVLLDVYGLNVTYEVVPPPDGALRGGRRRQGRRRGGKGGGVGVEGGCSLLGCSVAGHCLANHDLSRYRCSCFEGHFGDRCQYGRECDPLRNVSRCLNGGKCRHVGSTAIHCACPRGFYGPLCEGRRAPPKRKGPDSGAERGGKGRRRKVKVGGTPGGARGSPESLGVQCLFDGEQESVCNCRSGYKVKKGDRWLFEGNFRIANLTGRTSARDRSEDLETSLKKQLTRFLKRQNATRVSGVTIGNVSEDGAVSFSFLVGEDDGSRVRGALERLVQDEQHLGEHLLSPDSVEIRQGPALLLLEVALDRGSVTPGAGFAASCVAQGSPSMEFRWYKDGDLVDHTKASRHMWQRLLPDDRPDTYTAILRVTEASTPEDMGAFWCHVSDGGRQQCGQVVVVEAGGPHREVYVRPRASTILRGGNLTLACTSPASSVGEATLVEFSWTKNDAPLTETPGKEVVEALYPSGSLLRIYDAQQSATYSCHVVDNSSALRTPLPGQPPYTLLGAGGEHGGAAHVAVSDPEDPMCPQESSWGVAWPRTAADQRASVECPPPGHPTTHHTTPDDRADHTLRGGPWGRTSVGSTWGPFHGSEVTRVCRDTAKWGEPDFSRCDYEPLRSLQKKFRRLTLGYLATSPERTLQEMLDWLMSTGNRDPSYDAKYPEGSRDPLLVHSPRLPLLLPGQIGSILRLLEEVQSYLCDRTVVESPTPSEVDVVESSYSLLKVLDVLLLKHPSYVVDAEESFRLIRLARRQSTLWGHSLAPGALASSIQYPTEDLSNASMPRSGTPSVALFTHLEWVTNGNMRVPRPGQRIPPWFLEQVEATVSMKAPRVVDVLGQPEEKMIKDTSGEILIDPGTTAPPPLQPHTFLFSLVAFRSIGTQMPVTTQLKGHRWEYQLASHVISIDLRDQDEHHSQQKSMKFSSRDGRGLGRGDPTVITGGNLNLTLRFTLEPSGLLDGLTGRMACGLLTEGLRGANTSEIPSAWEVGPTISPSPGSTVTCHFDRPGTFAAFIVGKQLGDPNGQDPEGRTTLSEGWLGSMASEPGSGGGAILGLGFGTCITLCLLTLMRHALDVTSGRAWKKGPASLPPAARPSLSRRRVGDKASCSRKTVESKETTTTTTTDPKGESFPVELCLEMQCCLAVLIAMGFFLYGSLMLSPRSSHPYVIVLLEGSLLTGMASLLGIVLILHIEISSESRVESIDLLSSSAPVSVVCTGNGAAPGQTTLVSSRAVSQMTSSLCVCCMRHCTRTKLQCLPYLKFIVVGITIGTPLPLVLLLHLIQRICSSDIEPSWWITIDSSHFGIFMTLASIVTFLFAVFSTNLLRRLNSSAGQQEQQGEDEVKQKVSESTCNMKIRIKALKRAVTIFSSLAVMEIASVFYINFPISTTMQCILSITSLCLGVAIFLSYAVQGDQPSSCCKQLASFFTLGAVARQRSWVGLIRHSQWMTHRQQTEDHLESAVGENLGNLAL